MVEGSGEENNGYALVEIDPNGNIRLTGYRKQASLFVTGSFPVATNLATALIMAIGLVGVISAVRRKQAIQCACLGTVFNFPMSVVTIVENSAMLAMAVIMLVAG